MLISSLPVIKKHSKLSAIVTKTVKSIFRKLTDLKHMKLKNLLKLGPFLDEKSETIKEL